MGLKLHLGVIDLPYVNAPSKGQRKSTAGTMTTAHVSKILEDNYSIMGTFAARHGKDIADDLAKSMASSIDSLVMGAPLSHNVFGPAESKIENRMKKFIAEGEMDKLGLPGIPTQAALDRASGKKRSSRMKNKRRGSNQKPVSFYDTGLYQSSMKAWIE